MAKTLQSTISVSGRQGPMGPPGPKGDKGDPGPGGGVNTFNTRQGEVVPEIGDYTMEMVGGLPLTNTEIDALWNSI